MKSYAQLARVAYEAFYQRAGGVTYDGKPLAVWLQINAEQQACWIEAVRAVAAEVKHIH